MIRVLKVAVLTMVTLLTLTAVFLLTGNNNIDRSVIAQGEKLIYPPETAEQFADVIEGNDTAIILNDTNIGDVNNTVLDSVGVNVAEDCMNIPNSTVLYCP